MDFRKRLINALSLGEALSVAHVAARDWGMPLRDQQGVAQTVVVSNGRLTSVAYLYKREKPSFYEVRFLSASASTRVPQLTPWYDPRSHECIRLRR